MLFKKLFLIAAGLTILGAVHAQTQPYDSAPPVDIAAMEAANMQPAVKKVVKKPATTHKSAVKRSAKKHTKHHTHVAACDPKPEVVTCTMPAKP